MPEITPWECLDSGIRGLRGCDRPRVPYIFAIRQPPREDCMNPEERQMISGLFDRMRQQGGVDKDRDAEALIRDSVRQMPDAPYMMVQTVLVQEMALQNAQQQIDDLQDRVRALEAQSARPQQSSGGSFLGGLFGGSRAAPAPSAVPPARQSNAFGQPAGVGAARQGSPWGGAPGAGAPMQGGMMQQPQQPQQAAGGGFMRSAMATAAGVAGGMLAANAISNMMNGGSSAQASPASSSSGSGAGNDPAGSYDAASDQAGGDNDPAGNYDSSGDAGGFDDGGGWSEE